MEWFIKNKDLIIMGAVVLLFFGLSALGVTIMSLKPKPVCQVDLEKVVETAVLSYTVDGNTTDINTANMILNNIRNNVNAEKYGCSAILVRGAVLSLGNGKDITDAVLESVKKK